MDKNLIMLLGILALWVLVIRPMNRKTVSTDDIKDDVNTHESESGTMHSGGGSGFTVATKGRSSTL